MAFAPSTVFTMPRRFLTRAQVADELAISVLAAMSRIGLRAPDDLSVLGFDNHAMADRFGLSTVAQPVDVLGTTAARMALDLAAGETLTRKSVLVATHLMLRRSTGRVGLRT